MKRLIAVALIALVPLAACGAEGADGDESAEERDEKDDKDDKDGDDADDPKADDDGDEAVGARFDKALREDPCALLTPEMVAEHAGVKESDLKQRNIAGMCLYSWKAGGGGIANIGFINVSDDAATARKRFDTSYAEMTGEEVAAHMKKVGDRMEKKAKDGELGDSKIKVDPKSVEKVTDALGGAMAGGFSYEAVEGVGDKALYSGMKRETRAVGRTFVSYDNDMKVLVANMYFTSAFAPSGEPKQYKDENVALAKKILAALPD